MPTESELTVTTNEQTSGGTITSVSGVVELDGVPVSRTVRAFGYNPLPHEVDGATVDLSKTLGQAVSDPVNGEYTIELLGGYSSEVFVVAFDDYGSKFLPWLSMEVGDRIHPTTPNGYVYECVSGGELPETEPVWITDSEQTSSYGGTASLVAVPFYRPVVHGPIVPNIDGAIPAEPVMRPDSRYRPSGLISGLRTDTLEDLSGNHDILGIDLSLVSLGGRDAVYFNGSTSRAYCPRLPFGDSATIITWVSLPNVNDSDGAWFFCNRTSVKSDELKEAEFQLLYYDGKISFGLFNEDQTASPVFYTSPVVKNTMYMLAGVIDGTTHKLYVDGQLIGSGTITGQKVARAMLSGVGVRGWAITDSAYTPGAANANMHLYGLDLYYTKALSSSEILEIYNAGL